jgi:putative flippase GtrA
VLSFGLVGSVGLVVDVVVFNALRTTLFEPHLVHGGPIIAKVISTSIAIVVNWIGNRYWTFRTERRAQSRTAVVREGIEFAVVSLIGVGIALGCLWISHYRLGFTSVLDDNLATNVVGLTLGTAFRFTLYRFWVFSGDRRGTVDVAAPTLRQSEVLVPWLAYGECSLRLRREVFAAFVGIGASPRQGCRYRRSESVSLSEDSYPELRSPFIARTRPSDNDAFRQFAGIFGRKRERLNSRFRTGQLGPHKTAEQILISIEKRVSIAG